MATVSSAHPRSSIYYWKCDRPAAFHGTGQERSEEALAGALLRVLTQHMASEWIHVRAAGGQGNHATFIANIDNQEFFVRVEDGPEQDDYIEVESRVMAEVRSLGLPVPRVHKVDASRRDVGFAWQVLDLVSASDLNQVSRDGRLDLPRMAAVIGADVARWQVLSPFGFGPFDPVDLREGNALRGFHRSYRDYFHLNLDRHLRFLVARGFLGEVEAGSIVEAIEAHDALLSLTRGCLVHKDLALWNILGTESAITAYIDWDDSISGDPMDDLSLLGCFHDGTVVAAAMAGYETVKPLPAEYQRRFWLHLLRNMIVKAVIRVGAGYFERSQGFYLIGSGSSGADLKTFTRARLETALRGLRGDLPIDTL